MSIFELESLVIFAGNTQKYSQINYSKIAQKVINIENDDIVVASDCAALRVSVMQWRLEVILYTVLLLKVPQYSLMSSMNNFHYKALG